MTSNLTLSGGANFIDVADGGYLQLNQQIAANGQRDQRGGIDLSLAHTGSGLAVEVESGGVLLRYGTPVQGVANQVRISGAVYNMGGLVEVAPGNMLDLTNTDIAGYSYWQQNAASARLFVDAGANLSARGTYEIDFGTVQLTAPSGGSADELDGAGLNFGNANATNLTLTDSTMGTPGQVTVQGPVTLAANTTTTMNFTGGNNVPDMLDVKNGTLTLAGTLQLQSTDDNPPTQPLDFLDDSGAQPIIAGSFASIKDNFNNRYTGAWVGINPELTVLRVTRS
jgi:hypothetical protein